MVRSFTRIVRSVVFCSCLATSLACGTPSALGEDEKDGDQLQQSDSGTEKPNSPTDKDVRRWYQLLNVTIPPESPLRNRVDIDRPPQVYVIVKKDGKPIGTTSVVTGWAVDFPHDVANQFPIRSQSESRYTLEVWDDDTWSPGQNIFNITQIKGEEFAKETVRQEGGKYDQEESLAYTRWKEIPTPEKYRDTTSEEEKPEAPAAK